MSNGTNDASVIENAFVWVDPTTITIHKNPRGRQNSGFSVGEMAKLREDIRVNGHKLPLEIRYESDKEEPILIAGERRWRSIMGLIEEGAECFNRVTHKWEPASKVYGKVCCIVTETDEKNALVQAVLENVLHVPLSDYEILLHCQLLDEAGMSRKEQAEKLKVSEAWISQTFSLLNPEKCSPKVLEAMAEGILGRTQAIQFLNYPGEKADAILDRAIDRWKKDERAKTEAAQAERDALMDEWEAAGDKLSDAEESGDDDTAAKARRQLSEVEEKMEVADKNIKKVKANKKSKPRPSMEQIQDAAKDEGAESTAQRHMPMKTLRQYADKLTEVLNTPGAEIINPETEKPLSRRELQIVRDVCDCILSRNGLRTPVDALFLDEDDIPAGEFPGEVALAAAE